MWIKVKERMPELEHPVKCRLKHWNSEEVQEHKLIHVAEDDCSWRTADDRSEVSYNWDVIEWLDESPAV